MQLLQLFLEKGESIGIASLTTPMLDPPRIERVKIMNPSIFFPKAIHAEIFFLLIGNINVKPANPRANPNQSVLLC